MATNCKCISNPAENVLHISENMTGKMSGIPSISTACRMNPRCLARVKNGESICSHCFAMATTARYHSLEKNLEENASILSAGIIPADRLPLFKKTVSIARFESFGDLINVDHAINYINIARKNPHVRFALWTKNVDIIAEAVDRVGKPDNLTIIQSAVKMNVPEEPAAECVDKVFTVYTPEHIKAHSVNVNCGARACGTCAECYLDKTIREIREKLK